MVHGIGHALLFLYEAYCDNEHVWSDHNKETIKNVNCLVRDHIVKPPLGKGWKRLLLK